MGSAAAPRLLRRAGLVVAASLTVALAVGADVVAGQTVEHTAMLAAVATVVAVFRIRAAGRHRGPFAVASGAIVAQPALHAALKVLPDSDHGAAGTLHGATDASVTAVHMLAALVVVAGVTAAEHLFLVASMMRPAMRWLRLLLSPVPAPPQATAVAFPAPVSLIRRWHLAARIRRRGPPATARAAAVA